MSCYVIMYILCNFVFFLEAHMPSHVLPRARPRRTPSTALQAWLNRIDMPCVHAGPMGRFPGHDAVLDDRCHHNVV